MVAVATALGTGICRCGSASLLSTAPSTSVCGRACRRRALNTPNDASPKTNAAVARTAATCRSVILGRSATSAHMMLHGSDTSRESIGKAPRSPCAMDVSRRDFLRSVAAAPAAATVGKDAQKTAAGTVPITPQQDALLEDVERGCFQFFLEQSDLDTGLTKDRARVVGNDSSVVASIAASGFALTAFCIGEKRGYMKLAEAHQRVLTALRFLNDKMPTHRGFFYHFANIKTGQRIWDSEVSSIDTALLLCGLLTARAYFTHAEIDRLARDIFNRVEWEWLSEDTALLPQGWSPETGFLPYRWDLYSELMMIYLLGLGSVRHPIGVQAWNAWKRTKFEYDGLRYIGAFAPLFVHQYSQAWFDFRDRRDQFADYFLNSIRATEAHRRFCIELGREFHDYSADLWGITASDSQRGYVVWGGPPAMGPIDGQ